MKIFFDCEFTGLHQNTTLISIGLVAHNGESFYAELTDYDQVQIDKWIQHNVIDNLTMSLPEGYEEAFKSYIDTRTMMATGKTRFVQSALSEWLKRFDKVEMWGDCLAYDWVLFCQLWGHAFNIPKNIYYIPFDLSTLLEANGVDPDINREEFAEMTEGGPKHNALWDARVIRACHDRVQMVRAMDDME